MPRTAAMATTAVVSHDAIGVPVPDGWTSAASFGPHPALSFRNQLHPTKIIDDKAAYASMGAFWYGGECPFPSRGSFSARDQQRV